MHGNPVASERGMNLMIRKLALALAFTALPFEAIAQSSTAGEGAPNAESSLGMPKEGADVYVKDKFGDWQLICIRVADRQDPCELYQLLRDQDGNSVAEITLFVVPDDPQVVAGATIVTPLETLLTANLRLAVDGGEARIYRFLFCRSIGCFAQLGLTDDEIDQFRRGAAATVTIVPAAVPDRTVDLDMSLSGFTAGWNALVENDKAAAE